MRGLFGRMAAETKTDISALTWQSLFGGPSAKSGVSVNIDSALRVSTVLACCRVLAEGVAQLPLKIYRDGADGSKTEATDHPAYKLVYRRPNEWMTSFELRETMMFHAVLTGNAYAYIGRVGKEPRELIPLVPNNVTVNRSADYGLTYEVHDGQGLVGTFDRTQIMHLRGPSWNGYLGMDAVQLAREAIGLAIATEETHARFHSNGARPGGIISFDNPLSPEARERLKASAMENREGLQNAFKTMVLDSGAKWLPMMMNGVDAQHLETRKYQIEEICRALRVFPQMVGHSDKTSTFASAEAFFLAHVIHSLAPWIVRWEQTIERDLLDNADGLIAKFSLQGLLRGDAASRGTFYSTLYNVGALSPNDIRRFEDMNPYDGGDEYRVPLNMAPPGTVPDNTPTPADVAKAEALGLKVGRVLSGANHGRITTARDHLNTVLDTMPVDGGT